MIIGFLSGGFIGLVAGIFFMSMCQAAASGAEELTKKFEDGYQGKIPRPYEHGHGELYLCPNCSYLLLNSASRNNWCPNCKTRINWKKVDELGGEEKCGR